MNDSVGLALVITALYLSECVVWARHGAVVVTAPFLFRPKMHVLTRLTGTARGAFTILNPLPPFGLVYVVEPLPFTMTPDKVTASRRFALANEPPPVETGRELAWEDVVDVVVVDKEVHVARAVFARCSSARHARAAAAVLTRVAAEKSAKKRSRAIEDEITAHFDVDEARARALRHRRWSVPLLIGASGVFVALFVFVPRVVIATGVEHWQLLLASVYAWVLVSVVSMYVAHRKLAPEARGERWMQTLLMVPAPTMAMRGNDKLGRWLMAGLHPVAVALAVMSGAARDDVIGRALRDLKFPRAGGVCDERTLERVVALAKKEGVDVDAAFAAPKLREGQAAWCPRCRAPYRAMGSCSDCNVALVTLVPLT